MNYSFLKIRAIFSKILLVCTCCELIICCGSIICLHAVLNRIKLASNQYTISTKRLVEISVGKYYSNVLKSRTYVAVLPNIYHRKVDTSVFSDNSSNWPTFKFALQHLYQIIE